jgi:uncharacterized repeat protein (TIGR01451 family)
MNKTFFKIGLGMLALAGLAWPARGVETGVKTLPGHVPAAVSQLAAVNRVSTTNELHLAIGLPLRNQDVLQIWLRQVYDPANANYRHFLAPDEFAEQFGPTVADYQTVVHFAQTNGLTVLGVSSNRTLVDVVGKVADIQRAFHVNLHNYQHPSEARQFYAPDTEPTVDASLPILSVYGLNNYVLPRALHHINLTPSKAFGRFATGSSPSGSYWGYDFRNAYLPGVALTGTGQSVALFECDGYFPSDVSSYLAASGLPSVPLANVLVDGASGQPSGTGGEVEVALDIDMAISMAPGLAQVIVYETPFDVPAFNLDMLNQIATDDLANQISSSWLIDDTPQFAQIYIQFALQGQTFLQASGDEGAYYPGIFQFEDSPLVTLVGGTTLTSTGPGGIWASEQVWNTGFDSGGGGGISQVYSIPSWQTNINMTTNQGSTTMRNIPDVALTADNIYIWGDGAPITDIGGTSCAAPLWAGLMALVNQQIAANGKAPLGFINPTIYALAQGANYASLFHDIVVGNNTNNVQTTNYNAVPGYDLCTGWGTPNGPGLIPALVATASNNISYSPVIPAPKQPWGNTLSTMNGTDPNGLWFLFLRDDSANGYSGTNYNGWALSLTTANPVGFAADNELYINATNISLTPGSQWITTLSVTNYGPSASTNVVVTDTLPSLTGVTLLATNSSVPGSTIIVQGNNLTWKVGNLANTAGGTLTLTFQGNVTGTYTNGAVVSASTLDPNPDDNAVGVNVLVAVTTPPVLSPVFIHAGGGLQLSVTNNPGSTVIIQAATNLPTSSLPSTWVPVYTNVSPFTFVNFDNTNFPSRFYRAVISQ